MRCPKCGYISFDHLQECLKCEKDIKEVSNSFDGSVFNVQAPSFLKFEERSEEDTAMDEEMDMFADEDDSDDFLDEDLDILMQDDQDDAEIEIDSDEGISAPQLEEELDFSMEDDEEETGEIELDLNEFDAGSDTEDSFTMEVPEELEDMSDLAPPKKETASDEGFVDLDLDDLDLDLDGDASFGDAPGKGSAKEVELALDDIDFSDALLDGGSATSGKPASVNMDEDLDFDLDLGGLSIHSDLKEK